jgi:hypothetical protein
MEPVALIVTALAAGAGLGLKTATSSAVTDAYASLKSLTLKRLTGRQGGELILTRYEQDPEVWQGPLTAELSAAGADNDPDLVTTAQAVMSLIDAAGSQAGKYTVDVRDSRGVLIGDGNSQQYIETYIHSQVVQSSVPPAPKKAGKPSGNGNAGSRSKSASRLEAAEKLQRISVELAIPIYQVIARDSAARTSDRVRAAELLQRISVELATPIYQAIARDSRVRQ